MPWVSLPSLNSSRRVGPGCLSVPRQGGKVSDKKTQGPTKGQRETRADSIREGTLHRKSGDLSVELLHYELKSNLGQLAPQFWALVKQEVETYMISDLRCSKGK